MRDPCVQVGKVSARTEEVSQMMVQRAEQASGEHWLQTEQS